MKRCSVCSAEKPVHRSRTTGQLRCVQCAKGEGKYTSHASLPARNKEIVMWYVAGWGTCELGYAFELTSSHIYNIVRAAGVNRSRAQAQSVRKGIANRRRGSHSDRDERIISLHGKGKSLKQIGEAIGLSREKVRTILKSQGIQRSQQQTFELRKSTKPPIPAKQSKLLSTRAYLREVIPREWWEMAYNRPDCPSVQMIAEWLGDRNCHGGVYAALQHHGIKLRSRGAAFKAAWAEGRKRNGKSK